MNIRNWLAGFFILFIVVSCKKESTSNIPNNTIPAVTLLNVSYGTDAQQAMDVYLPAGRTSATTKSVIMVHGGGWSGGDKSEATWVAFVDTLKKRLPGYAIFNINYRLSASPNNLFPTQENDVKAAFQFIYAKAGDYLVSDKYVLIGASAGAHLAMLQAYKYSSPVKPKAVVSFFGPSDLVDMYNNPAGGNALISTVLASTIGKTPAEDPLLYYNSSPVNFINSTSPPTILLHGGMDPLVNASQSVAVQNGLQTAGVTNQYVFYPTGGHGDWNSTIYTDAFTKVQLFLTANVL